MNIHHHPKDETLMAYAAGTVAEALNFVIATHLSLCADCRKKVEAMENLGAVTLEDATPTPLETAALDKVMDRLEEDTNPDNLKPAKGHIPPYVPAPLREYLPSALDDLPWKKMAPGINTFPLSEVNPDVNAELGGSVRLLKIAPGVTIPQHSHTGTELTLVLRGSFSDEIGRFKMGDMVELDEAVDHQPIADSAEDCICLIATEGPLEFKALMPRLVQYFTGV